MIKEVTLPGDRIFRITQDDYPDSPREWDNLGTMACFHNRYSLGDSNIPFSSGEFDNWLEMENHIWKELDAAVVLPLFLYDHSGITISTSSFSCRWDSGQIGFIYVTKDTLKKEFNVKRITEQIKEKATKILEGEVETYDQYITGDVYSYEIVKINKCEHGHKHEETEGSCSGFYGDDWKNNGILDDLSKEEAEIILGQL
jgi:hypothetical protein